MRSSLTPLIAVASLVLTTTASAQFKSAQPLIPKADSKPVAGIPYDGMWSSQYFIGEGNDFLTPVDGGYLDVVEHKHVSWDAEQRTYHGIHGRDMRVMPLGDSRLLMEYDLSFGKKTRPYQWQNRYLIQRNVI